MNHNFTYEELCLLSIDPADHRRDAIFYLESALMNIEDPELYAICSSAIEKLEAMNDDDYHQLLDTLIPDYDPTEV